MGKIISFSGRISSGKSELAKICMNKGYEKLYFALPLKKLVADLIDVDISDINVLKNVERHYEFNDKKYAFLSEQTDIPNNIIKEKMSSVNFKTVRQLLQFIGTDLIRRYNINWHVNKIRDMIDSEKDYVFDDVRFPNELKLIRELGGDCWFIVRPDISTVSNHESETTLLWRDFGNMIIINDGTLNMFKFKWETFFDNYDVSMVARNAFLNSDSAKKWQEIYADIEEMMTSVDLLEISPYYLTYKDRAFNCSEISDIKQNSRKCVEITYNDGTSELVKNPLNIEDLKLCIN